MNVTSVGILALAFIGAFALASVAVGLFFALGRRPRRLVATAAPEVDSDEFLAAIAGLVNGTVQKGGTLALLNNGAAFYPELEREIAAARRSINFMVYIWEPGKVGDRMFELLAERARAGVRVRVMLDGLGGIRAPKEGIERLEQAGVTVARFRPPRFGMLTRFHKRNHRRAIVIDGAVGFTGGMAIGDKWEGNARNPDEWRDFMVRVTGCLAANLQSAFAELWAHCHGEILVGDDYYTPDGSEPEHAQAAEPAAPIRHIGVISSPSSEEHPLRHFYVLSFLAARQRLWMTTPYFVPDQPMREVLAERARAGVDVRVLLPNEHTDATPIRLAGHAYYEELLAAGVRIWEFQPTFLHAKALVIDGRWSVVGSANMDVRSKELNEENVLGILDAAFAGQLETTFVAYLERAREIRLEEWKRRGSAARIAERIARVFAEQY